MRLIDRHELRKALEDNICADCEKDPNNLRCGACLMDAAIEYIIAAPAIEAVEVVRCKDCKHAKEMTQYGCGECVRHCEKLKIVTSPEWFCAEGRKKDEGGPD